MKEKTLWLLLALAIIIAAVLHGGVYEIVATHKLPAAYKVNRFTGKTWFLAGSQQQETKAK